HPREDDFIDTEAMQAALAGGHIHLLDARTPERWRGEVEPVDPVPGRIPGAINAPATEKVRDFRFRQPNQLHSYYQRLGILDGKTIVASCGSGVAACIDLLGLELAGVSGAKLYPGSYSAWLAKGLPVEKG